MSRRETNVEFINFSIAINQKMNNQALLIDEKWKHQKAKITREIGTRGQ
jgi:hypothetical protein